MKHELSKVVIKTKAKIFHPPGEKGRGGGETSEKHEK
jgi:hypothetical protein